jgi:hypothetical protein
MKKTFILMLTLLALSRCVTEKVATPEDTQFLKVGNEAGPVATKITVRCHVQNGKTKKPTGCASMTVKTTNQVTKATNSENFKSGAGLATVGRDVYVVDVTTSNCLVTRNFVGLMAGMTVDVYFDPPCGVK